MHQLTPATPFSSLLGTLAHPCTRRFHLCYPQSASPALAPITPPPFTGHSWPPKVPGLLQPTYPHMACCSLYPSSANITSAVPPLRWHIEHWGNSYWALGEGGVLKPQRLTWKGTGLL